MAEEEAKPEAEDLEPDEFPTRKRRVVLGAIGAAVIAVGAAGYLILARGSDEGREGELRASRETSREARVPATAVDGIDYEEELGVILPLALVSAEGGEGEHGDRHIGKIVPLDDFVVNISDHERDRYLKLKAELELSIPELTDELDQRMPQIRDLIIGLLGNKSFEEVRTIEGKNFLREEILLRINSLLVSGKVKRVFFTEFVVQ